MNERIALIAALIALGACLTDVSLGDREASSIDASAACVCASPRTNDCSNCPDPGVCDPEAGIVCPCASSDDCPPGYDCVVPPDLNVTSCTPADNVPSGR